MSSTNSLVGPEVVRRADTRLVDVFAGSTGFSVAVVVLPLDIDGVDALVPTLRLLLGTASAETSVALDERAAGGVTADVPGSDSKSVGLTEVLPDWGSTALEGEKTEFTSCMPSCCRSSRLPFLVGGGGNGMAEKTKAVSDSRRLGWRVGWNRRTASSLSHYGQSQSRFLELTK